jgi:hypothetical protein
MDATVLTFERNLLYDVDCRPAFNEMAGICIKDSRHDAFLFHALRLRGGKRVSAIKTPHDDEKAENSAISHSVIEKPRLKMPHTEERTQLKKVVSRPKPVQVSSDDDDDSVGMIHQEPTPSMRYHVDTLAPRDAASYAAEAARCLGELDVDGALACYAEAVRLEPRSGVFLDAYGSLLADCGRFA